MALNSYVLSNFGLRYAELGTQVLLNNDVVVCKGDGANAPKHEVLSDFIGNCPDSDE